MVEVLHFTGGEIIPRRVLCPWRAHLLASTLPAVARVTAACFVRCAWVVGRGLGLLRGSGRATSQFRFPLTKSQQNVTGCVPLRRE